ncbi:MAG: HPP family protein [Chloroflexi bacterium]|jgi:CBS-domain-containing membrane protein|nr:HPP family protein [Chloroflexota bacterium]
MTTHAETPPSFVDKVKGTKTASGLPYPKWYIPIVAAVGGMLSIMVLQLFSVNWELIPCFIVPFGASCVLLYAAPAAPFSQPRNLVGGHIIAALVGVAVFVVFKEASWWTLALANGLAIALMVATKTVHPPAGATAFLPLISGITDWTWVLVPVGVGTLILLVIALIYNNVFKHQRYPAFWY